MNKEDLTDFNNTLIYENGFRAGANRERERCIKAVKDEMVVLEEELSGIYMNDLYCRAVRKAKRNIRKRIEKGAEG